MGQSAASLSREDYERSSNCCSQAKSYNERPILIRPTSLMGVALEECSNLNIGDNSSRLLRRPLDVANFIEPLI